MTQKKKTLFMETTSVDSHKTAGEITSLLVASGARHIGMEYDDRQHMTGLRFVLVVHGAPLPYQLPVRVEPVFKILNGRRRGSYDQSRHKAADLEQAERVAWRQLLRWLQAQIAMIETGMVAADEVFLPYAQDKTGRTVYQIFTENKYKGLLPAAETSGA